MTSPGLELVVFDCDGVLVDSERLAVRSEVEILARLGWPLTEREVIDRFVGRSSAYMHAEVERALGRSVDWEAEFESRYAEVFDAELVAIDGVAEAVGALLAAGLAVCVASSSTYDAIEYKLTRTGLWDHFAGATFSVEDVTSGKPAPDVFLLAASSLGVRVGSCAVVEDSPSGIEAGLAAGMRVFGFAAGLVDRELLEVPRVCVFDEMRELPALLGVGRPSPI